MNPLDNLTVCVTNFKRPNYLDRTLQSLQDAGIRRVVVASVEGGPEVDFIIEKHRLRSPWLTFDVARLPVDIGCNNTWMLAAYHSQTERVIIMHDDDLLARGFGEAYRSTISPALDRGVGFASWRASLFFDDGRTEATEFWEGPTRILSAKELLRVVAHRNRLSLSPIISVFNRTTLIHACKEAEQFLTHNDCLLHQGMLLGTELVVYMRHIRASKDWLYVDQVLSHYGSHDGSGTIQAQKSGRTGMTELFRGYDLAREQAEKAKPIPRPKILLVTPPFSASNIEDEWRICTAQKSWQFLFDQFDVLHFPVGPKVHRTTHPEGLHYVRDLFSHGCQYALPEDIVMYVNADVGLTTQTYERVVEGVTRGNGVTICPRRSLNPMPGRHYKHLLNCKTDGGFDAMAIRPELWKDHFRNKLPDFVIGREGWDTCFRVLAEEHADAPKRISQLSTRAVQWSRSKAYTDHVCWHKPHPPRWMAERTTNPDQIRNRKLARDFFAARGSGFREQVKALSS